MAHSHNDNTHACQRHKYAVCQTLDEMVFERGLWNAALDGDIERVEMLLGRGHDPRAEDSGGYTPLHYAARNGHFHVCELLLKHGADVNATTPSIKATPLHRAATQGHAETVKTLLRHGANANLKDTDGKTALHRAISSHASSMETLQDSSLSNTCMLLLPHTDLNIKDNTGQNTKELISETYNETLNKLGPEAAKLMKDSLLGKTSDEDMDKKALEEKKALEDKKIIEDFERTKITDRVKEEINEMIKRKREEIEKFLSEQKKTETKI